MHIYDLSEWQSPSLKDRARQIETWINFDSLRAGRMYTRRGGGKKHKVRWIEARKGENESIEH